VTPIGSRSARELWRAAQHVENWVAVSPTSSISPSTDLSLLGNQVDVQLDEFVRDGYGRVRLHPIDAALAARTCIEDVVAAGLPAVFAYVYDQTWTLLRPLLAHVTDRIGPCAPLDDGWAWHMPPGDGVGWPGHRGSYLPGSEGGAQQVVNTWLALTDVTERHSTIALVPTSADPHFPDSLDCHPDEDLGRLVTAQTGEAIYWDARVFHWGSRGFADVNGPRISTSFTIASDDFRPTARRIPPQLPGLDFRLQLIAGWVGTYAHLDNQISPPIVEWARLWQTAGRVAGDPAS